MDKIEMRVVRIIVPMGVSFYVIIATMFLVFFLHNCKYVSARMTPVKIQTRILYNDVFLFKAHRTSCFFHIGTLCHHTW